MNQKIAVSAVFVAAMFMNIMDVTIVNVALPTLGREFAVRSDAVATVSIGYLVSLAVFMPASGWVGDRLGGRRTLLTAVVIFTGASALCGVSQSLGELVGFRVLQGVGGGMMAPVGMAMLYRTFPPQERVRASSILVVPTALAPALGPVLGGLFVTDLSWRWVFFVNVPIGIAAVVFGILFLGRHEQPHPGRFDLPGFLLAGLGLALVMYGVSEGPQIGWHTPRVIATCLAGAGLLLTLVFVELRVPAPMIDLRLFKDRLFAACNAALVLGSVAFIGGLFLIALFFQDGLGLSALQSGLSTFPEALGVMAGSQVVTRGVYPLLGPRRVMMGGLTVVGGSLLLLTQVSFATNLWLVRLVLFVLGMGMSAVFVPSQAAGFATITPAETARASTLFNANRQLGGAVGVALLTTVLAAVGPIKLVHGHPASNLAAYHTAFVVAALVAFVGVLVALTIADA
ncbi:MAG: multidrug efflux MFS transporter, partial [Acidimicrobiaceae bacterium]|nr:multidrug efflux MFS transporter [Acidimicrobiaceae bacterium]